MQKITRTACAVSDRNEAIGARTQARAQNIRRRPLDLYTTPNEG